MSRDNKAILLRANAAIVANDHEGFLANCTDDVEWRFIGDRTLTGKQVVRQYMKSVYIEPPKFTVSRLIAEDDFVTAIGTIDLKDGAGGVKHFAYCDVWRIRDGKLAELQAFVVELGNHASIGQA